MLWMKQQQHLSTEVYESVWSRTGWRRTARAGGYSPSRCRQFSIYLTFNSSFLLPAVLSATTSKTTTLPANRKPQSLSVLWSGPPPDHPGRWCWCWCWAAACRRCRSALQDQRGPTCRQARVQTATPHHLAHLSHPNSRVFVLQTEAEAWTRLSLLFSTCYVISTAAASVFSGRKNRSRAYSEIIISYLYISFIPFALLALDIAFPLHAADSFNK